MCAMRLVRNPGAECGQDRTHRRHQSVSKNRKQNVYVELLRLSESSSETMLWNLDMNDQSSLIKMTEDPNISSENMQLLVKVLATAVSNNSCQVVARRLIFTVFSNTFNTKLLDFLSQCTEQSFISDLISLFSYYINNTELDDRESNFAQLLQCVKLVSRKISRTNNKSTMDGRVAQLIKRHETGDEAKLNFREQQIEPSTDDMNQSKSIFKYFNKTVGQYSSVDTYLETHFQLMREDFIRPLREGLHQYLSRIEGRNFDISIYENVRIVGISIIQEKLVYRVKFNNGNNLRLAESHKKILPGNLVLISSDCFRSFHFAVIEEREETLLKIGIVGISFVSETKVDMQKTYSLIEPTNFYVAYKHVLTALQFLNEDNFPLVEHIVYVEKKVCPPVYLSAANPSLKSKYDLDVVVNPSLLPQSISRESIFAESNKPNLRTQDTSHAAIVAPVVNYALKNVVVTDDIGSWPSVDKFKLDQSQLAALRLALTSRMALIQGPPGTGKTFIGLKIVLTLLFNSTVWSRVSVHKNIQPPILIVCYTNHALDQFLEGIQKFTRKIIRIGGGCKSDDLIPNQINELMQIAFRDKKFSREIGSAGYNLHQELSDLENKFHILQRQLSAVVEKRGIIKLNLFKHYKIIPDDVIIKLFSKQDYLDWILPNPENVHRSTIINNGVEEDEITQVFHDLTITCFHESQKKKSPTLSDVMESTADFEFFEDTSPFVELEKLVTFLAPTEFKKMQMEMDAMNTIPTYVTNDILYLEMERNVDIYRLTCQDRWLLYASWKIRLEEHYRNTIKDLQEISDRVPNSTKFDEIKTSGENAQSKLIFYKSLLKGLRTVKGLVKLKTFLERKIIKDNISKQLTPTKYRQWLLTCNKTVQIMTPSFKMWNIWKPQPNALLSDDTTVWLDSVEAYRDMLPVSRNKSMMQPIELSEPFFEITPQNCAKKIIALHGQKASMNDNSLDSEIEELQSKRRFLNHVLMMIVEAKSSACETEIKVNVPNLSLVDRCRLYASWRRLLIEKLQHEISIFHNELQELAEERLAIKMSRYLHICRQADVVGMTTTGAAKWQSLVNDLKPKIGENIFQNYL